MAFCLNLKVNLKANWKWIELNMHQPNLMQPCWSMSYGLYLCSNNKWICCTLLSVTFVLKRQCKCCTENKFNCYTSISYWKQTDHYSFQNNRQGNVVAICLLIYSKSFLFCYSEKSSSQSKPISLHNNLLEGQCRAMMRFDYNARIENVRWNVYDEI